MTLIEKLRLALGLKADADEDGVVQAATAAHSAVAAHAAEIGRIAKAAGAPATANADAVVTALQARGAGGLNEVVALQAQVTQLQQDQARTKATAVVDAAMRAGKPIPATRREEVITKHMADPAGTEAWLEMLPSLNGGGMGDRGALPPAAGAGIDGSDQAVIAMMGIDPAAYAKRKAALGEAVHAGAGA